MKMLLKVIIRGNRGRSSDLRFRDIGDVPRIYGLQNWIYLIHTGHASKSPHRPVRRSFSEDVRPWSAAPYHCEGD